MDPGTIVVAGLGVGLVLSLSTDRVLYQLEALWLRRSSSVAAAATLGAAVGDAGLIAIGGWLGWQIATMVQPGTRAALAAGLFVGLAAKALLSHLMLPAREVPRDTPLPVEHRRAFGSFLRAELLTPTPAILAAGVVAAWPRLWALDTAGPFVAAVVLGCAAWRLQWAMDGLGRRRKWGSRAIPEAVTILAIGLLVGMAVGAMPR